MQNYCIVPKNSNDFWTFINKNLLNIDEKESLKRAKIKHVEIDPKEATWEILLTTDYALSDVFLKKLSIQLIQSYQLNAVFFQQKIIKLDEYLKDNWNKLAKIVANGNPTVMHLLLNANYYVRDYHIYVEFSGALSSEIIEAHAVKRMMKLAIKEDFHSKFELEFIINDEFAIEAEDDIMTKEYLDALKEAPLKKDLTLGRAMKKDTTSVSAILFGKNIKDNPISISSITDEARNVIIKGNLINFDKKDLRTGRQLLTFDIGDLSDGISCKIFLDDKEKAEKTSKDIVNGLTVKVKGTVQFDKYANELTMFVDSLVKVSTSERFDSAELKRVELHAHTHMSNMDAVVSIKNLINTAAKWGHSAITITDHGVVQAFPEAHLVAKKANIKVIYGMEGYLVDGDLNHANHIVLLAKNTIGLRNLYQIVSLSHLKFLHRTPRIPRKIITEYREGLIVGSACEAGELIQSIIEGKDDDELFKIASFYDYLEIQPIGNNEFLLREGIIKDENGLKNINRKVAELAEKLNLPLVATCDVHFLNPEDEIYRRILMAGKGFKDADHQPPLYLRTTEEMLNEFSYLGKEKAFEAVITNTRKIADMVEKIEPIPDEDKLYSPQIPGAEEQIKSMSYNKAKSLYGEILPKIVADRLTMELNSIIGHGYAVLYLIAQKLVKKSLDDGYLVGSRGSVGSSFVANMADITEVNSLPPHWRCPKCKHSEFITDGSYGCGFDLPDKFCPICQTEMVKDGHNIPFAVFMGFNGDKVPDIDLNFSGDYQPIAHKYTEELFGKDNVFKAGTIGSIAEKTAYGYVKKYFNDRGTIVRNAFANSLVAGCTGVKRTTGQHPGGIMVIPRNMDVHYFTPIQHPADDKNTSIITTHFDYHSISGRLVKLDILGHDDPTVIKMLEDLTLRDPLTIPFDDKATMSLFSSTEALNTTPEELGTQTGTYGIPEFGTKFVRQMLDDTKPKTFSELVRISGFSHGTDVWLNNAQDLIRNGTAKVSETISARDDIMLYLIQQGVDPLLSFKTMENVRKGKGIAPEVVSKLKASDVPDWFIDSCQKIKYLFPKAHAVAYVMMAYRIAYCKVHYPLAFYAAYFTIRADEFDAVLISQGKEVIRKTLKDLEAKGNDLSVKEKGLVTVLEIALEMYLRGFVLEKVNLYKSAASKFITYNNSLLPPLGGLQGVGEVAANNIVAVRAQRPFSSIEDLKARTGISKTTIEVLREHGCLDGMTETDQIELFG